LGIEHARPRGRAARAGENADTRAALPRVWARSLGGQRTTGEKTASRPNTQPGLPSNNHLWKLPRSGPSPLAPPRVGVLRKHHVNANVGAQPAAGSPAYVVLDLVTDLDLLERSSGGFRRRTTVASAVFAPDDDGAAVVWGTRPACSRRRRSNARPSSILTFTLRRRAKGGEVFFACQIRRVGDSGLDILGFERGVFGPDLVLGHSGEVGEHDRHHDPRAPDTGLPVTDSRIPAT
jgi:hypothetical protein